MVKSVFSLLFIAFSFVFQDISAQQNTAASKSTQATTVDTSTKPDPASIKVDSGKPTQKVEPKPAATSNNEPTGKKSSDTPPSDPAEAKKQTEEEKRKDRIAQAEIKKVEWIEKTMKYGINKERKDAISFIPTVADAAKKDALAAKMTEIMKTENDAGVMVRSIETAAEIKYAPAVPVIITALDHKSEDVRISAVYGLKTLDAKSAAGTIFERLKNADLSVDSNFTNGLIETLGAFAHAPLAPLAQEKITDFKTTKNHRLSLLIALGKIKDPASVEFLMKLFKDPNEDIDVRSYAVNAIANIGHKASGPEIDAIMKEIDTYPFEKRKKFYPLYMYCVTSLVRLGDVSSYPRLEDSLKSDNTAVRIQAIRLMKELKDQRSIDILKYKAEYDPAPKVQSEAFDALKEFGIDYKKELEDKKKGSTPATK